TIQVDPLFILGWQIVIEVAWVTAHTCWTNVQTLFYELEFGDGEPEGCTTGPVPGGRVRAKIPAPTRPRAASAQMPNANVEVAVTADSSSGPVSMPVSDSNRHNARNFGRPTAGE